MENSRLILLDSWGVYIPQMYCSDIDNADAKLIGVQFSDVETCQQGPDHPKYWESWQAILDSATWQDDSGQHWHLWQDGDLWEVTADCELPDYF